MSQMQLLKSNRIRPVKIVSMAVAAWALFSAPVLAADEATITSVEVGESQVEIRLDGSAEGASVSAFSESDPTRAIVDMLGVSLGQVAGLHLGDSALIQKAEISIFSDDSGDITRMTVFLNQAATPTVLAQGDSILLTLEAGANGGGLFAAMEKATLSVEETEDSRALDASRGVAEGPGTPSGPQQAIEGLSLTSVDYVDEENLARVVIGSSDGIDYVSSQPGPNLVVVDFPGAKVPKSLKRTLDASRFISPVRMVRAFETSSGARVSMSLRESSTWNIHTKDNGLVYVDFTLSSEMKEARRLATQSFSEVAPSTPSEQGQEGLSGAYGTESLIGETGKTMNPQAVFGTGGGADNPAAMIGGVAGFTFDSDTASGSKWHGQRINLDLEEAPIHAVFRLISHVSQLNIVSGDDVVGTVTVSLRDVPWDQAFSAVLQAKGMAAQRFGNIIRVAPIETIKAEQQSALEAKKAKDELTPLQILIIPLNYAKAAEIGEQIQTQLSGRGTVEVDTRSNQVIIKETEERLAQLRELVRNLDKETPQVLIEARVVEANSRFSRSLGIQWGGELDASARTGYNTGLIFPNSVGLAGGSTNDPGNTSAQFFSPGEENLAVDLGADGSMGALAFNLGSVSGLVDIDARLSAMEIDGWGEIVSSPRITTLDNTTARIQQGAKVPFLSSSSGGTQVQFITAALVLEVTPHITSDDKIFMKLNIQNNRPDFSQTVQGQPAIQVKEAETELLVANGDTTVIGGVFSTEEAETINRVPLFGKIPLLGWLFQSKSRNVSRNEMLVFVTPRIATQVTSD
jgi:type IV pilus assembly protein PilQ